MNKNYLIGIGMLLLLIVSVNVSAVSITDDLLIYHGLDLNTNDLTGHGFNASIIGSVPYTTGFIGNASSFSGSLSNYLQSTNDAKKNFYNSNYTLSVWVKTSQSTSGDFMSNAEPNSPYYGWELGISGNSGYVGKIIHYSTSASVGYSSKSINNNTWVYVVITSTIKNSTNTNVTFYINGIYDNSYIGASPSQNNTIYMTFGGRNGVYNAYNGLLDEIGLWNRSLSSTEIYSLYTNYKSGCTPLNYSLCNMIPSVSFVSPSPVNNSLIYYHDVTFNTTTGDLNNYNYTTINIYQSDGVSLYDSSTSTAINYSYTSHSMPSGNYKFIAKKYLTNVSIEDTGMYNFTIQPPLSFNITIPQNNTILPICNNTLITKNITISWNDNANPSNTFYYMPYMYNSTNGSITYLYDLNGTNSYTTQNLSFNMLWQPLNYSVYGINKILHIGLLLNPPQPSTPTGGYFSNSLNIISNTTIEFCQPQWINYTTVCNNYGTQQILYYDNNSCNYACEVPINNGSFQNCTSELQQNITQLLNITQQNQETANNTYYFIIIILAIIIIGILIYFKQRKSN